MKRIDVPSVCAGDIIGIPCDNKTTVFDTLCSLKVHEHLPADEIDQPTLSIRLLANDSPSRGTEGDKLLISDIGKRLEDEASVNVCLTVNKVGDSAYEVLGRGELQLAVLLENMRREGFELMVAPPKVLHSLAFAFARAHRSIFRAGRHPNGQRNGKRIRTLRARNHRYPA